MKNLIESVLKVMEECEGIDKSLTVGSGRNSYRGVSDKDVKLKVGRSMRKHGLVIFPTKVTPSFQLDRWEEDDTYNKTAPYPKKTKQSVFSEVITEYELYHKSGEHITLSGFGHGVDSQDKSAGKASTYALKYTLLYTFMVATGYIDDSDTTHSNDTPTPSKTKSLNPITEEMIKAMSAAVKEGKTPKDKSKIDVSLNKRGYKSLTDEQFKKIIG